VILAKLQTGEIGLAGLAVPLRAAYYTFSLGGAGLGFFTLLFGTRQRAGDAARLRRWTAAAALLGLLFGFATIATHVAMLAEHGMPADSETWGIMLASGAGTSHALGGAGLLLLALSGFGARWTWLAATGGLVVCASYVFMGHSTQVVPRLPVACLLSVHLAVAAFWLGSLPALLLVLQQGHGAAPIVETWSRAAMIAVPVLLAAGLALSWSILGSLRDLIRSGYGWALVAKVIGVTVMLGFAAWNRYRLTPAIAAAQPGAAQRLARSIAAEAIVALLVLYAAAEMTSTSPPGFPHRMH